MNQHDSRHHDVPAPRIIGRSSSHFTRVVRMFAEECGVPYEFQIVPGLLADDPAVYGGHPGLRLPNVVTARGPVFGSLGGCRMLGSLCQRPPDIVWPEATPAGIAANALELTLQAMSTEVTLIMVRATGGEASAYAHKLAVALDGMLAWLDANVAAATGDLPERALSYLELSLFCLVDHLEFRGVTAIDGYRHLVTFRDEFAKRPSAIATPYQFDK